MYADFATLTGTHHSAVAEANQDYGLAEVRGSRAWAVLSDGCSTGARTDLGARAWALAGHRLLAAGPLAAQENLLQALIDEAEGDLARLSPEDALATVLMLDVEASKLRAAFFGDGALLLRRQDGELTFVNVVMTANAPQYPAYHRNPEFLASWQEHFGASTRRVTFNRLSESGELLGLKVYEEPVTQPDWRYELDWQAQGVDFVAIATDGLFSFQEPATLFGVAQAVVNVRSPAGAFMRRRLGKMGREGLRTGALPVDDCSIAAVWTGR